MLYIVRGCPGSGKSTWVKTHLPGIYHLENDMFHMRNGKYAWGQARQKLAVRWCQKMAEIAVKSGMDVVVSNVFATKKSMEFYLNLDSSAKVIRCEGKFKNQHNVPTATLINMRRNFEDYEGETIVNAK